MPKKKEKGEKAEKKPPAPKKVVEEPTVEQPPDPNYQPKQRFDPNDPLFFDLTRPTFEKELLQQERERVEVFSEKKAQLEVSIEKRKREIREKAKEIAKAVPKKLVYVPLEPIKKSEKLKEFEKQIRKGKFLDSEYKKWVNKYDLRYSQTWRVPYVYGNTFESVGLEHHRIWKPVY